MKRLGTALGVVAVVALLAACAYPALAAWEPPFGPWDAKPLPAGWVPPWAKPEGCLASGSWPAYAGQVDVPAPGPVQVYVDWERRVVLLYRVGAGRLEPLGVLDPWGTLGQSR